MRFSYRIFRVFGIDVRVHLSFLFIVAYFAYRLGRAGGAGWGLGSSLRSAARGAALRPGGDTRVDPCAGRSALRDRGQRASPCCPSAAWRPWTRCPRNPRKELAISIAGRLSNLVIALLMFGMRFRFVVDWSTLSLERVSELHPRAQLRGRLCLHLLHQRRSGRVQPAARLPHGRRAGLPRLSGHAHGRARATRWR